MDCKTTYVQSYGTAQRHSNCTMPWLENSSVSLYLVRCCNVWQQAENTRTLYFASEFTLAASAVSSLAARLNLTHFVNEAFQRINLFIVEALAFRAIFVPPATTATRA